MIKIAVYGKGGIGKSTIVSNLSAALAQQGDGTLEARRNLLVRQREQLTARMADMQASLDRLDYKIDLYARRIAQQDRQSPEEHGGST